MYVQLQWPPNTKPLKERAAVVLTIDVFEPFAVNPALTGLTVQLPG